MIVSREEAFNAIMKAIPTYDKEKSAVKNAIETFLDTGIDHKERDRLLLWLKSQPFVLL